MILQYEGVTEITINTISSNAQNFIIYLDRVFYILKIPNLVSVIGELSAALKLRPRTLRESTGSMTPSSQSLKINENRIKIPITF